MNRETVVEYIDKIIKRGGETFNKTYDKEATLQTRVLQVLKKIPMIWVTKVSDRYITGVPDIIGCIAGRFFAIELKATKGKPSKLQLYNIKKIEEARGNVCIARTVAESLELIKSTCQTSGM